MPDETKIEVTQRARDELLPCPFCKGLPRLSWTATAPRGHFAECLNRGCEASVRGFWTEEGAITAWNTRADLRQSTPAVVEALARNPKAQASGEEKDAAWDAVLADFPESVRHTAANLAGHSWDVTLIGERLLVSCAWYSPESCALYSKNGDKQPMGEMLFKAAYPIGEKYQKYATYNKHLGEYRCTTINTTALSAAHQPQTDPNELRVAVQRALQASLGDTYDCTRVWEAWGVGTMDQDDFVPVLDRMEEIIDEVAHQIGLAPQTDPQGEAKSLISLSAREKAIVGAWMDALSPAEPLAELRLRQVLTDYDKGWEDALDAAQQPLRDAFERGRMQGSEEERARTRIAPTDPVEAEAVRKARVEEGKKTALAALEQSAIRQQAEQGDGA